MKKCITFMLLLAMAGSTHAELVLKNNNRFSVVPNVFTTSGKTVFYSGGDETGEVVIYSPDNFTPKTFNVGGGVEYQIGEYSEEAIVTLTGMNVFPESVDGRKNYSLSIADFEASSQEEMINKLGSYYVAFTDPMGNPACYYDYFRYFKYYNIFGNQYPTQWYALIDGMVYQIYTYGSFYSPAYDEESAIWIRTSEEIQTYTKGCTGLTLYFNGLCYTTHDGFGDVWITQNLFNNDDKWEYVLPEYGPLSYRPYNINNIIDNGDGTVTLKRNGDVRTPLMGYAVYNEDGTKLYSIKDEDSEGGLLVYLDDNRVYYRTIEGDYYCIYELNKETGDIDLVEKVQAKGERKLGASHGIVTVDIDAEQAGGEVVVSTTDGKVIANKKVGIGQTQINDQPLPAGIYVVSLLKDGRVVESEKYLVQ